MAGLTASVGESEGAAMDRNTIMRFPGQVNRSNRVRWMADAGLHHPLIECGERPLTLQPVPLLLVAHAVLQSRQQVEGDISLLEVFCFGVCQVMRERSERRFARRRHDL